MDIAFDVFLALVQAGGCLFAKDSDCRPLLFSVVEHSTHSPSEYIRQVEYMFAHGVNKNVKDSQGRNALFYAYSNEMKAFLATAVAL